MAEVNFQLKGSVVTTILLEIQTFLLDSILAELKQKVEQVPHFFNQAPIIVDITKMNSNINIEQFDALVESLFGLGLGVIGWRCDPDNIPAWRTAVTIPLLPATKTSTTNTLIQSNDEKNSSEVVIKTVVEEKRIAKTARVISRPIRSGQQMYAEGDLIILSQVSEGAEVLADGNIHVYGPLRGRALAGVKGDTEARIFCKSMEAELVSIAGNFMLSDALQKIIWKDGAQVLLNENNLEIMPL